MPKVTNELGIAFDSEFGMAKSISEYAEQKLGKGFGCYHVTFPNGYAEYMLWRVKLGQVIPIRSSQSAEDLFTYLDMAHLARLDQLGELSP